MKNITKLIIAASLLLIAGSIYAFTLGTGDKVKVKIVKIIDGDTSITEKIVDESEIPAINKELEGIKGKNVKVMLYVNDINEDKKTGKEENEERITMNKNFTFDIDSMMKTFKIELNIDSMMNSIGNGFNFKIETDDDHNGKEKTILLKRTGTNMYSFSTDSASVDINITNDEKGDGKNSTIIITTDDGDKNKKVIVKTSVVTVEEKRSTGKKMNRKEDDDTEVKFYPNPSDGKFTIEYELKSKEPAVITITDVNGKQLFKDMIKGGGKYSKQVDLGNNGKGIFILNLQQGKKSISKKIVIE